MPSGPLACSFAVMLTAESGMVVDGRSDCFDEVRVIDEVDLASAFAAGAHEACEFEFGQVLADGCHGLSDLTGEGADIPFALGEQPDDVQPGACREHAEGRRDVLEQVVVQFGARGMVGHGVPLRLTEA